MKGWEDDYVIKGGKGGKFGKGGKGSKGEIFWEDGFAAGLAAAKGGGKGRGPREAFYTDRSRSPRGSWSHDLWSDSRGSSKGYSKGGGRADRADRDNDVYANFGGSGKGKGKDRESGKGDKGRKGGSKSKGRGSNGDEDVPDANKLDADLAKYFGKEPEKPAKGSGKGSKGGKGGKGKETASADDLDKQLNAYFGESKKPEATSVAEKKAETDEVMAEAAPEKKEEKAAEAAK
eukprot:CAMPEP_0168371038 /NCGR_PEP_ID=MMETSP0228-20121227/7568_1 /TAXON_ID=133427 /ORGANISM="Protoceratium reticulatum, Strain CCCM 535 (=CCMP 1889)" /LENGTH=232 /DNA_ID=CAMNT_0008383919 /DNA_START=14 /DNA_END=712 /DNA_ORIENTATION=-